MARESVDASGLQPPEPGQLLVRQRDIEIRQDLFRETLLDCRQIRDGSLDELRPAEFTGLHVHDPGFRFELAFHDPVRADQGRVGVEQSSDLLRTVRIDRAARGEFPFREDLLDPLAFDEDQPIAGREIADEKVRQSLAQPVPLRVGAAVVEVHHRHDQRRRPVRRRLLRPSGNSRAYDHRQDQKQGCPHRR